MEGRFIPQRTDIFHMVCRPGVPHVEVVPLVVRCPCGSACEERAPDCVRSRSPLLPDRPLLGWHGRWGKSCYGGLRGKGGGPSTGFGVEEGCGGGEEVRSRFDVTCRLVCGVFEYRRVQAEVLWNCKTEWMKMGERHAYRSVIRQACNDVWP